MRDNRFASPARATNKHTTLAVTIHGTLFFVILGEAVHTSVYVTAQDFNTSATTRSCCGTVSSGNIGSESTCAADFSATG